MNDNAPKDVGDSSLTGEDYVVVARRYRPQNFEQLIGQQMATKALKSAISSNRVGHAYLFTGARGVGKTSTARIFSKALNCVQGPTEQPCGTCDICQSIASGEDVDVLEIDGASNRGIDEIRQLRSNVAVRPSRARFKVYIIDEVHMLTRDAFNALLKTLEEPPDHVKFLFCTTEPEKIPITVLSRCQRFDFAPVDKRSIIARLQEIVEGENATADEQALELLARRAAGSLRDSQSLLEQLLAFAGNQITVESVHALLGTAGSSVVEGLAQALLQRNAAEALRQLDAAVQQGADVGQVAEQLLGYLRDVMAAAVGASADLLRTVPASDLKQLQDWGAQWGIPSLLAAVQILDQGLVRLRQSVDPRTVVETALVRISCLEDLSSISSLFMEGSSTPAAKSVKTPSAARTSALPTPKKKEPVDRSDSAGVTALPSEPSRANASRDSISAGQEAVSSAGQEAVSSTVAGREALTENTEKPHPTASTVALTEANADEVWRSTVAQMKGLDANFAGNYHSVRLPSKDRLVVEFGKSINAERCRRPENKADIEAILERLTGRRIRIDVVVSQQASRRAKQSTRNSQQGLIRDAMNDPFVQKAIELFDADVIRVIDGDSKASGE